MRLEQKVQFETQGFLHLPNALDPALLRRFRTAFDNAIAKHAKPGNSAVFDIPQILDEDDLFVDLVDTPSVFPIIREIIGSDVQLLQTQARIFPPGPTITAPWHSDLALINGIDLGHSLNFMLKAHFYPEDLEPEQGCLAFIPGSHRYPVGYPNVKIDHEKDSPATVRIVPRAGDVVLFNVHTMHMALDNKTHKTRKSLIYSYSHFWVKSYLSAVPNDLERLANTQMRRQLFGIPSSNPERSYFEQTIDKPGVRSEVDDFLSAGRKLVSKTKALYLRS
jgi:hypothetical protein